MRDIYCLWKVMAQNEEPEGEAKLAQKHSDWFRLHKICSRADMALFRTITTAKAKAYKGHAPCTPSPTAKPIARPHSATSVITNHCALWSASDELMLANVEKPFFFFCLFFTVALCSQGSLISRYNPQIFTTAPFRVDLSWHRALTEAVLGVKLKKTVESLLATA